MPAVNHSASYSLQITNQYLAIFFLFWALRHQLFLRRFASFVAMVRQFWQISYGLHTQFVGAYGSRTSAMQVHVKGHGTLFVFSSRSSNPNPCTVTVNYVLQGVITYSTSECLYCTEPTSYWETIYSQISWIT